MNPIKIFLFLSLLLLIAYGFDNKETFLEKEITIVKDSLLQITIVESTPIVKVEPDTIVEKNIRQNSNSAYSAFFERLKNVSDTLVRVIWYGDSQLEGDHFTHAIRTHFQQQFGGDGIGYLPAEMYFNTTENLAVISDNFDKHLVSKTDIEGSNAYGLYGRYFTPNKEKNEIRFKNRSGKHTYQQLKIIYSGASELNVEVKNENVRSFDLNSAQINQLAISFKDTPSDVKLSFSNHKYLKIYAILLDSDVGVAVDHVPFRGSLNLMLNQFQGENYRQMGNMLKPSLVVLQYGLNIIPDVRTEYSNYTIALRRDIQLLKKYIPSASILIIGAPDMAHKVNGEFESYPNINAIIEAQKEAALKENVAFWDLRKAMGGEKSIVSWVADGLARTDYAHLTSEGAAKAANLFIQDLMLEYQKYTSAND